MSFILFISISLSRFRLQQPTLLLLLCYSSESKETSKNHLFQASLLSISIQSPREKLKAAIFAPLLLHLPSHKDPPIPWGGCPTSPLLSLTSPSSSPSSLCPLPTSGPFPKLQQTLFLFLSITTSPFSRFVALIPPIRQGSMKTKRGFRLGRRLIRVWRCVLLRRSNRYQRLDSTTPKPSKPRLFDWARRFFACSGGGGGGGRTDYRRIETSCTGEKPPPRGHLAVYVGSGVKGGGQRGQEEDGSGSKRYVVPVIYFNHPLFGELLREAEEEFGYEHPGGITIPCPVATFERVRTRIIAESTKPQLFH